MEGFNEQQDSLSDRILSLLPGKLRYARVRADFTQQQLASILNCSTSTIAMQETGRRQPSIKFLIDFCRVTKTDISWIFSDSFSHNYEDKKYSEDSKKDDRERMIEEIANHLRGCSTLKIAALRAFFSADEFTKTITE